MKLKLLIIIFMHFSFLIKVDSATETIQENYSDSNSTLRPIKLSENYYSYNINHSSLCRDNISIPPSPSLPSPQLSQVLHSPVLPSYTNYSSTNNHPLTQSSDFGIQQPVINPIATPSSLFPISQQTAPLTAFPSYQSYQPRPIAIRQNESPLLPFQDSSIYLKSNALSPFHFSPLNTSFSHLPSLSTTTANITLPKTTQSIPCGPFYNNSIAQPAGILPSINNFLPSEKQNNNELLPYPGFYETDIDKRQIEQSRSPWTYNEYNSRKSSVTPPLPAPSPDTTLSSSPDILPDNLDLSQRLQQFPDFNSESITTPLRSSQFFLPPIE